MKNKDQILLENLYFIVLEGKNLHGWMNPNGKLFPLKSGENHYDGAYEIMSKIYKMQHRDISSQMHTDRNYGFLFERNWMRITYEGSWVFCHNPEMKPTQKQISELKNLCIENKKTRLDYDDDEDSYTLWSSEDKF